MRMLGRVLAGLVGAALLCALALTIVFPANKLSGPADPIVELRRGTLDFLRKHGIVAEPGFWVMDPWLPEQGSTEWMVEEAVGARMTRTVEPVYRGLFWVMGKRVTMRLEEIIPPHDDYEEWQLGYVKDNRVVIAATATYPEGTTDFVLGGFVPTPVDGLFLYGTERGGSASMICAWGTERMDRAMKAAGLD